MPLNTSRQIDNRNTKITLSNSDTEYTMGITKVMFNFEEFPCLQHIHPQLKNKNRGKRSTIHMTH